MASTTAFSTARPYHLQHNSETLSVVSEMPGLERANSSTSASSERRPVTPAQAGAPARPPPDSSSQCSSVSTSPDDTPRATDTNREYMLSEFLQTVRPFEVDSLLQCELPWRLGTAHSPLLVVSLGTMCKLWACKSLASMLKFWVAPACLVSSAIFS